MDNINKEKAELVNFKELVFKLENQIAKLEFELTLIKKKKQEKFREDDSHYKEIFIIDPCQAVISINDELLLYKSIYTNLSNHYRALQININQYERIILDLKYDNSKLEKDIREKEKIIQISILNTNTVATKLQTEIDERETDINRRMSTNNLEHPKSQPTLLKKSSSITKQTKIRSIEDDNSLSDANKLEAKNITEKLYPNYGMTPTSCFSNSSNRIEKLDISEWRDVVRIVGFTEIEYNQIFKKNIKNNKISEAIDVINTILIDRNKQISLLNLENSKLNNENKVLYDENLMLNKKISILETKISSLNEKLDDLQKKQTFPYDHKNDQDSMGTSSFNYQTADTNKNELLFNSIPASSMITINRVNIKSINQINTVRHYDKTGNRNTFLDYYKNVNLPDDSSSDEIENEYNNCLKSPNTATTREKVLSISNRKKMFSCYPNNNEKLTIQIPISKMDKSILMKGDYKDPITKRSQMCISPSLKNDETNRNNKERSGSLKKRVLERLSNPSARRPKYSESTNRPELIKIEDQKDIFFELTHNTKAISDIKKINYTESKSPLPKNASTSDNAALRAMDKLLGLKSNEKAEVCLTNITKERAGTSLIRKEVNNDLNNLIDLFDDDPFEDVKIKDPKQFTFDTCNSKQFQTDLEKCTKGSNFRGEELNIEVPSSRLS